MVFIYGLCQCVNLWTFSLKSLCLHSISEMMILSMSVRACMFFRLWLEKRPVISQSPATQDRLYIWAPRYWYIMNIFFIFTELFMFSFNCNWCECHASDISLFSNIAVCSHHDSQDLERGTSDDMLGRYVKVDPCKSILIKQTHWMRSVDLIYAPSLMFLCPANWLSDEAGAFSWGSFSGLVIPWGNS